MMEKTIKKLGILLISSTILFAQDFSKMRVLESISQIQRNIELAKSEGASQKNPYHFEKAVASRDVANTLASNMDEVGSRFFMVKAFNALSKAMSGKMELDSIKFVTEVETEKVEYQKALGLDINSLESNLKYVRENKALNCAPTELARAEIYYEAFVYELSNPRPNTSRLINFYSRAQTEANNALQKVNIAKEGNIECYTGKPFVPEIARNETETLPTETKVEQPTISEVSTPQPREEFLTVTARIHFDFGKHNIKKEYIPFLNEVVKTLKENSNVSIRIEGFTDDVGSKDYNQRLALMRAQAVRDYLIKAGIPADRIEVAGFGKERYISENTTSIGRFTNRRAEFIVIQVPGQ